MASWWGISSHNRGETELEYLWLLKKARVVGGVRFLLNFLSKIRTFNFGRSHLLCLGLYCGQALYAQLGVNVSKMEQQVRKVVSSRQTI